MSQSMKPWGVRGSSEIYAPNKHCPDWTVTNGEETVYVDSMDSDGAVRAAIELDKKKKERDANAQNKS